MKRRRVVIGGLPYFGRMLAAMLSGEDWEARYLESAGKRPQSWAAAARAIASADLVYLIGGQIQRWSRPDWLLRWAGRPVVMHWVGSDVTFAASALRRGLASRRLISMPVHWAEVAWTAAELRPLGIQALVVPLTSARMAPEPLPLPRCFTVLTYLPETRPDFYGRPAVIEIAARVPETRFLVVGTDGAGWEAPPNMQFLGWQTDMAPVYARASVLLRLSEHDGLSFMVLEALAAGRHVIWNHALDGVVAVASAGPACAQIERLHALHRAGELRLNDAGRSAVRAIYDPARVRSAILRQFDRLVDASRGRRGSA